MSDALTEHSTQVLATHARSFHFAARCLPEHARRDAAVLYALCREIDDLADETPDPGEARIALEGVRREIVGPERGELVAAAVRILERGPGTEPLEHLLDGVTEDLEPRRLQTDAELVRYGYLVAGTVGLMMCPAIGVTDPQAHAPAVDLGTAMQITNICRDVLEDAERDRVYLPADRLRRAGVDPEELIAGKADRDAVARVVLDLLDLADTYYARGVAGLHYIPLRSRIGIAVAAAVYREIGTLLRARRGDALAGRVSTSLARKVGVGLWAAVRTLGSDLLSRMQKITGRGGASRSALPEGQR